MSMFRQPSNVGKRGQGGVRLAMTALTLAISLPALADTGFGGGGAAPAPMASPAAPAAAGGAPAATAAPAAVAAAPAAGAPAAMAGSGPAPMAAAPAPAPVAPPEPPRIRTVYLSDTDRARILAELKQQVVQEAKDENWAQPNTFPDWITRIHFSGDVTFRSENDLYDKNNSNEFLNFQTMNTKGPTNIAPPASGQPLTLPFIDTTEDRYLPRIRAHLGLFATVSDDMDAVMRLSTGSTSNPGSANVTVGNDFEKPSILLDRAYMNYHPIEGGAVALGRMANPFSTPDDMVWAKELAFDGASVQYHVSPTRHLSLMATGGMFSILTTDTSFPTDSLSKGYNHNDWLYAGQLGVDWLGESGTDARFAVAYYDFANIQGKLSSLCNPITTAVSCDTDNTIPDFMQKGNTVMAVRNLVPVSSSNPYQYQYFGLASQFRVLDLTGTLDFVVDGPLHLAFDADFADNLAFSRQAIEQNGGGPLNNLGACPGGSTSCNQPYVGGGEGDQIQVRVGYPKLSERGQWNAAVGYRDLQSDAVVDAFNDQDFHLGGTNAKGYFIAAGYGFTHNASVTARWLSATEDSGPPLAIDVFQLDVTARF